MKKIIYEGLNTKCLIFNLTVYNKTPEYSETQVCKLLKWLLTFKHMTGDLTYGNILENMTPIFVESVCENYTDGTPLWKQTCLFVYKIPAVDGNKIFDMFTHNRVTIYDPIVLDVPVPEITICKIILGTGKTCSDIIVPNTCQNRDNVYNWLAIQSVTNNYSESKVLGFSAKNSRAKYLQTVLGWYGTVPAYELTVAIFENMAQSIDGDRAWLWSCHITDGRNGRGVENGAFNNPLHAYICDNSLIIYDNEKSFKDVQPKLFSKLYEKYDTIIFDHYGILGSKRAITAVIAVLPGYNNGSVRVPYSTLTFLMINKVYIKKVVPRQTRGECFECIVDYEPTPKHKFQFSTSLTDTRNTNNYYVLPYSKEDNSEFEALDILSDWFYTPSFNHRKEIQASYINKCLLNQGEENGDIMSEWFKLCTANAKSDEERLREAYMNLKMGLIQEYRDIGIYLAKNNFNDKKPVPSIILGKGLERSPEKKLAFMHKMYTVNEINYIQLDKPISSKELYVKFLIPEPVKNSPRYINGEAKLAEFYDKNTNNITLDINNIISKGIEGMR